MTVYELVETNLANRTIRQLDVFTDREDAMYSMALNVANHLLHGMNACKTATGAMVWEHCDPFLTTMVKYDIYALEC